MTNPPQQPDPWQEPSWSPAEQQQQPQQPSYPDPYGNASVPPGSPAAYPTSPGYAAPAGYTVPPGYQGYPGYGYQTPVASPPNNTLAIVSLVLSLCGLCTGITAVVGAILGHVARRQIRQRGEGGAGMALAGIIVGWILTACWLAYVAFVIIMMVVAVRNSGSNPTY